MQRLRFQEEAKAATKVEKFTVYPYGPSALRGALISSDYSTQAFSWAGVTERVIPPYSKMQKDMPKVNYVPNQFFPQQTQKKIMNPQYKRDPLWLYTNDRINTTTKQAPSKPYVDPRFIIDSPFGTSYSSKSDCSSSCSSDSFSCSFDSSIDCSSSSCSCDSCDSFSDC